MAMTPPPRDPWYRRYYTSYNRPYGGCAFLYLFLVLLLILGLLGLVWEPLTFWYWW